MKDKKLEPFKTTSHLMLQKMLLIAFFLFLQIFIIKIIIKLIIYY